MLKLLPFAICLLLAGEALAQSAPSSTAYGIWTPSATDSCTKTIHDSYSVIGPDGKRYPTWHPPVDVATGCTFGHEHGKDPRNSEVYDLTDGLPFGVANEALTAYDPLGMRHEDHVGHKVEWLNNVKIGTVTCDFLTRIHQGTHSADAFSNNAHELGYFARCTDGTELAINKLAAFGQPGEFIKGCDKITPITAQPAMPMDSPIGPGSRNIPDLACAKEYVLVPTGQTSQFFPGMYEPWESENSIFTRGGKVLAYFDPSFAVTNGARYFDPAQPNNLAYAINLCYMMEANGDKVQGTNNCSSVSNKPPIPYTDLKSPFNGTNRTTTFIQTKVTNDRGPAIWYTDPYGGNAQTTPFVGSIQQYIAPIDNTATLKIIVKSVTVNYNAQGVHAPN